MTFLTIFTAPKPFTNGHIDAIQRNAITSWTHLDKLGGPRPQTSQPLAGESAVQVILIGEEAGLAEAAAELGVLHVPQVRRNAEGTPLVSDIFEQARRHSDSPLLAYVNADILLLPEFLDIARHISQQAEKFLVVGQRWDLDMHLEDGATRRLAFGPDWVDALQSDVHQRGRLHPPGGSDYFIFPRACFTAMPAFAIGRAGWDNWMFYHARKQGWPVINATRSLQVLHQDHDYSHLPGGQIHYRLPETTENIRLAGGRRTIFTLHDADFELVENRIVPTPLRGAKLLRELETWPLRRLPGRLAFAAAEISFAIFHPGKAWKEWRGRLHYFINKRFPKKADGKSNPPGAGNQQDGSEGWQA